GCYPLCAGPARGRRDHRGCVVVVVGAEGEQLTLQLVGPGRREVHGHGAADAGEGRATLALPRCDPRGGGGSRVSTTLCETPGRVSSHPTAAAAAASDPTPGTIS